MKEELVLRRADEKRASGEGYSAGISALPLDLVSEAAKRVGWLGLIYATGFLLIYFGPRLIVGTPVLELLAKPQSIIAAVSILLGLAVFLLSRNTSIAPHRLLDLGLVFEVIGALGISMSEFWGMFPEYSRELLLTRFYGIPWECVWIVGFPLLAPNTPGKTLAASLAAASTGPFTVLLSAVAGLGLPDAPLYFFVGYFLFTTYLCAAVAYLISRGIIRYGVRLKKAREAGNYNLIERLGAGGMGEVWAASHRMLACPAAVKLIRPDLLGGSESGRRVALKRFEREAKATAALTSCHTITIYDFGFTEDGSFFYVMELLNGLNLEALVANFGPISAPRTVHLLCQVCGSLSEAHENGLIHRDIKPANIFTCQLGHDYDFIKVLDFGLVKSTRRVDTGTQLTGEGLAAGTPAYMAPEMALEKSEVDSRADIYATGCVAYWLLTGQPVFQGKGAVETILDHVRAEPTPPSQRTEIEIPDALEQAVLACLRKDPADRPQTADELSELLADSVRTDEWNNKKQQEWWQLHLEGSDLITPSRGLGLSPQQILEALR